MISYRIDYDPRSWLPVPDDEDAAWPDRVVTHYQDQLGPLPDGLQQALRDAADAVRRLRTDLTGQMLMFCPVPAAPAIGVLGIDVVETTEAVDLRAEVEQDPTALLAPAVTDLADDYWGTGRRAAVVIGSSAEGEQGGRFNYAFQRGDSLLIATAVADRLDHATVMMAHADRVVTGVRLEDR